MEGSMARSVVTISLLLLAAASAWGQAPPIAVADQYQVNTYTTSVQIAPAVEIDPSGNAVVVWQSTGSFGDDSSSRSVQAQRYQAISVPAGNQFQANSYTSFAQQDAAVAMDDAGNFVVVWESGGSDGTDTSDESIQAQRFNAVGSPVGAEFQVNSYTTDEQSDPAVAMDSAGNFVVVWESYGSYGTDDSYNSIQGQLFDSNGTPVGGQFQVNTDTASYQNDSAVTADGLGNFIVVWHSQFVSVKGQRYDSNGAPLGGEFEVDSAGYGSGPNVAADSAGNFVVAWESEEAGGSDTSNSSVEAQRFDANGDSVGAQFQVNTYTTDFQEDPTVAIDSDGNFIIVWESDHNPQEDPVQAQYYDSAGTPVGGEFRVSGMFGPQNPSIAMGPVGEFAVVWDQEYAPGDTSSRSIHARHYSAGAAILFTDGFESGNTSAWSVVSP